MLYFLTPDSGESQSAGVRDPDDASKAGAMPSRMASAGLVNLLLEMITMKGMEPRASHTKRMRSQARLLKYRLCGW